jgi:hypothetical protein
MKDGSDVKSGAPVLHALPGVRWRRRRLERLSFAAVGLAAIALGLAVGGCGGSASPEAPAKIWSAPQLIADDVGPTDIVMDPAGNGMLLGTHLDRVPVDVLALRYSVKTGWSPPELLESSDLYMSNASVRFDAAGNAVALWMAAGGNTRQIMASHYSPALGWGSAEPLQTSNIANEGEPVLAVNSSGDAVALWIQAGSPSWNLQLWSSRYLHAGGWSAPSRVASVGVASGSPQVALDTHGNAIALWGVHGIQASVSSGGGWTAPVTLSPADYYVDPPRIAMDAAGNVVAVWRQTPREPSAAPYQLWAARYDSSRGWSAAASIQPEGAVGVGNFDMAMGPGGTAMVVWEAHSGGSPVEILASASASGAVWSAPVRIDSPASLESFFPRVALDGTGGAVAVWEQSDGTGLFAWSNRYQADSGWGDPIQLGTDSVGQASLFVSADRDGNALAVWERFAGGHYHLWACRLG